MIFRPNITNTNTNPNTITNINIEITNTDFRSAIFPFKITNQTQISDLWFSFFPFRNHKHKHKFTWLRRTEPRKKKEKKKKEKRKKNGDSVRSATARMKRSWDLRETGMARTKLPPSLLKSVGTARTVSSSGIGTSIYQKRESR